MRNFPVLPTPSALPLGRIGVPGKPLRVVELALDHAAIARFNDVLHGIHPDAPHVDEDRFAHLARWLLELSPKQSQREIQQRLRRVIDLKKMAADPDWDNDESQRARLARLLEYLNDSSDMTPDRTSRLERLDDALLVELAWPAFADEVEDYLDFCHFRHDQHPRGAPPLKRSAWIRMRTAEGALWQQLQRVRHSRYAEFGPISEGPRVS